MNAREGSWVCMDEPSSYIHTNIQNSQLQGQAACMLGDVAVGLSPSAIGDLGRRYNRRSS